MVSAVSGLLEAFPETQDTLPLIFELSSAVVSGAGVYLMALFGLWRIAGRPDGAEARLFGAGVNAAGYLLRRWSARRSA
jgi:hypothetical protein